MAIASRLLPKIQHRVDHNSFYMRCIYGIFGRKITKYILIYTVIYGVYIRFWPNLDLDHVLFTYK